MGWGVLDDSRTTFPTGTVLLDDNTQEDGIVLHKDGLKRIGNVILQPQPDDSPNDPLGWSTTWKLTHLLIVGFGSAATNALTTIVIPGIVPLTERLNVSDAEISTWIITAPTFFTSATALFVTSGADIWGRRPFYVFSIAALAMINFVAFLATTYPVLAASRIAAGLFSAPLFTLVTATIADMFFLHNRGMAVAFWNVSLTVGAQAGQVVAGYVTDAYGPSAVFGLAAGVYILILPASYFLVLESGYFNRGVAKAPRPLDAAATTQDWDEADDGKAPASMTPRIPYRQRLALFQGSMTNKKFWLGSLKPLLLLSSPIVVYSALLNTLVLILLAGVATLVSILLSAPPYNLTPTEIGLTNLPLLAVALIGGPLVGFMSDATVRFMARSYKVKSGSAGQAGLVEPEFRLVLLLLFLPLGAGALAALGNAIESGLPLFWVLTWMSVLNLAAIAGVQIAISYLVDYLPSHSAQAFSSVNMTAALVVFAGIAPLIQWTDVAGPRVVFNFLAGLAIASLVFTVPMYIFGKRIRGWYGRTKLAKILLD